MLDDKTVVITGAGSGLGRAMARKFAERNCFVVGFGRTEAHLRETSNYVGSPRFTYDVVDVADYAQVQAAFVRVAAKHGRVDFLFNNAAVYPKRSFLEESADDWAEAIAINVNGSANCCKAALPIMIRAGFGRIYNLGSFADRSPIANSAAYSCSKGAIHALGKSIAADLAGLSVDVEVHEWIPGHLRTQMSDFTGLDPDVSAAWAVQIASIPKSGGSKLFVNDAEWVPPVGLRERLKNLLLFRR